MSENHERSSFSDHQARILAEVLDAIIPPSADGLLPGAGRIDLAGAIEDALRQTPEVLAMIVQGLSSIDERVKRVMAAVCCTTRTVTGKTICRTCSQKVCQFVTCSVEL